MKKITETSGDSQKVSDIGLKNAEKTLHFLNHSKEISGTETKKIRFPRSKSRFGIPGIGPRTEQSLVNAGFDTPEKLANAGYSLTEVPGVGLTTACNILTFYNRTLDYPNMREIVDCNTAEVTIRNKIIKPWRIYKKTEDVAPGPVDFKPQGTTVWSFEKRGAWASHTPQYPGNWSPEVVRNIILRYSKPGDTVLDPMVGGGTTPVECLLTGRNSISSDINPDAIAIVRDRLDLPESITRGLPATTHRTYVGDTRKLDLIADGSIDLIATRPLYASIIKYAPSVQGDLSAFNSYDLFFSEFKRAIVEYHRILKPNGYCAILVGDTHNRGHYVPVANRMMLDFLKQGFILKEDIIKREWNCESNRHLQKYANADFMFTMHEHLYIFRKPNGKESLKNSSYSFLNIG